MAMSEISKTRVRVDKFGGHIGAIISNVDLRINHDEDVYTEIRHAFDEHGVIFIYDQELTMEQYVAFGRKLGTLAVGDGQRDLVQGLHGPGAGPVELRHVGQLDGCPRLRVRPRSPGYRGERGLAVGATAHELTCGFPSAASSLLSGPRS